MYNLLSDFDAEVYRLYINSCDVQVAIDSDGLIIKWPTEAEELWGYKSSEVLGKRLGVRSDRSQDRLPLIGGAMKSSFEHDQMINGFMRSEDRFAGMSRAREIISYRKDGIKVPIKIALAKAYPDAKRVKETGDDRDILVALIKGKFTPKPLPKDGRLQAFVSYARADGAAVTAEVYDFLKTEGISCWYDQTSIAAGTDWREELNQGIERCECIIAIVTDGFVESTYCQQEMDLAARYNKPVIQVFLSVETHRKSALRERYPSLINVQRLAWLDTQSYEDKVRALKTTVLKDTGDREYHSNLLKKALHWANTEKVPENLLKKDAAEAALEWLRSPTFTVRPCQDQAEYVTASVLRQSSGSPDVFLAHSGADVEVVSQLRNQLTLRGIVCWFSPHGSINVGTEYRNQILEGLEASTVVVAVLSKNSASSDGQRAEIEHALWLRKKLIPYVLDKEGFSSASGHVRRIQAINHDSNNLEELMRAIRYEEDTWQTYSKWCSAVGRWVRSEGRSLLNTSDCIDLDSFLKVHRNMCPKEFGHLLKKSRHANDPPTKMIGLSIVGTMVAGVLTWGTVQYFTHISSAAYKLSELTGYPFEMVEDAIADSDISTYEQVGFHMAWGTFIGSDPDRAHVLFTSNISHDTSGGVIDFGKPGAQQPALFFNSAIATTQRGSVITCETYQTDGLSAGLQSLMTREAPRDDDGGIADDSKYTALCPIPGWKGIDGFIPASYIAVSDHSESAALNHALGLQYKALSDRRAAQIQIEEGQDSGRTGR